LGVFTWLIPWIGADNVIVWWINYTLCKVFVSSLQSWGRRIISARLFACVQSHIISWFEVIPLTPVGDVFFSFPYMQLGFCGSVKTITIQPDLWRFCSLCRLEFYSKMLLSRSCKVGRIGNNSIFQEIVDYVVNFSSQNSQFLKIKF
jgi:hypothetical protein